MKVILKKLTIRELAENYKNHLEEGVVGYGGLLDIRPPYQREFVYNNKQQQAVIDTVTKGFPLNIMYWAVKRSNKESQENSTEVSEANQDNKDIQDISDNQEERYEIIDGQQRTLSICRYVNGDFSYEGKYFYNLWDEEKDNILDYELDVYLCEGAESEKLDWFRTINIAGEKLTDQELRNAVYHGPWVTDAKKYFSKTGCPAFQVGSDYLVGSTIRQDYLETIIKWISKDKIEDYMGKHQHTESAEDLWDYFESIIKWIEKVFPNYRKEMKGLPWGPLYDEYKDLVDQDDFDSQIIENRVKELMKDEDITNKKGVYQYVLSGDEKHLNIRLFSPRQRRTAYEQQNGICVKCEEEFDFDYMEADHVIPWSKGGQTIQENCQMLCKECNGRKSDK